MIAILAMTPYTPDGDQARRWAEQELSRPEYEAAKPTIVDQWARAVVDFLGNLLTPGRGADAGPVALVIVIVLIVAALVAVLLIWGRPRRSRAVPRHAQLLGSADDRSAARLRADAERAAKAGEWSEAIVLRYRALARGLLERDLIAPAPGATARTIAREAATAFTGEEAALTRAAASFDDVRYLDHEGDADRYRDLAATDDRLRAARPEPVPA